MRQKIFQPLEVTTAPAGCPSKKMSVQKKVSLRAITGYTQGISPGNYRIYPAKHFGDFWTLKMKMALGLPAQYKFYSLKDTGITDLIRSNTDLLSVRDQARHHSLQMTDLYTPLESRVANESIRHHESYF